MIYGTKQYKNGKITGRLKFDTGKQIYLNAKEVEELKMKIRLWQWEAIEKEKVGNINN